MAEKGTVQIFLDLSEYADIMTNTAANLIASDVRKFARRNVRVDARWLQNSIRLEKWPDGYVVLSETPYSLAQEYGLEPFGKPNYGFTPYMRPAAIEAASDANVLKRIRDAETVAQRRARKKK